MLKEKERYRVTRAFWGRWFVGDRSPLDGEKARQDAEKELGTLKPELIEQDLSRLANSIIEQALDDQKILEIWCSPIAVHCLATMDAAERLNDELKRLLQVRGPMFAYDAIWREIDIALQNMAAVSRYLYPMRNQDPKLHALFQSRGAKLREALCIPDAYLQDLRRMRNAIEHFDEYLDLALADHEVVCDKVTKAELEIEAQRSQHVVLRSFALDKRIVTIRDDQISIEEISEAARNILAVINSNIVGRGRFFDQGRMAPREYRGLRRKKPLAITSKTPSR